VSLCLYCQRPIRFIASWAKGRAKWFAVNLDGSAHRHYFPSEAPHEHREYCGSPEVKTLYIREVHDIATGHKQVFVPWGYTCVCCGKIGYEEKWHTKNNARYDSLHKRTLKYTERRQNKSFNRLTKQESDRRLMQVLKEVTEKKK